MEARKALRLDPFSHMGTPMEIAKRFGGPKKYAQAARELETGLHRASGWDESIQKQLPSHSLQRQE